MKDEIFEILDKFYKKLYDNVFRERKKILNNSVLLTLLNVSSNRASAVLNESSIKHYAFSKNDLKDLEKRQFIRLSDDENRLDEYILTALGIFEVEKRKKGLNEDKLLEFLQSKFFSFTEASRSLGIKEKTILLSMIGVRTFSRDSTMNLKNDTVQDYWLKIFIESYNFLLNYNFIKIDSSIFVKKGNEHPVSYSMRRLDKLPKKTHHIYKYLGTRQYYLDIAEDSELSKSKLKRLFKLLFGVIDDTEIIKKILEFCNNIAYEKSKYVKDDFMFIEPKYDDIIKDSLMELYFD